MSKACLDHDGTSDHHPAQRVHVIGTSRGGGGGGVQLGIYIVRMCVSKSEGYGSLLRLQVNEMNQKMSFKMGVKFAAPFCMVRNY